MFGPYPRNDIARLLGVNHNPLEQFLENMKWIYDAPKFLDNIEPLRVDEGDEKDSDFFVIKVGDNVTPDDIEVNITEKKLEVKVMKKTGIGQQFLHRSLTLHGEDEFDVDAMEARLETGDVIIYAPLVEKEEQQEKEKPASVSLNVNKTKSIDKDKENPDKES